MNTKEHIKAGKDSGYSYCCILYFLIRLIYVNFRLFVLKWPIYGSIGDRKPKYNHVVCPICRFKLKNKEVKYYKCKDCGWIQFEDPCCNNCLQGKLTGTRPYKVPWYDGLILTCGETDNNLGELK